MKYTKKWYIILLICVITLTAFESCNRHHRFKSMLKHRRTVTMRRYHSPYQRRLKRKTVAIGKNYIIRNKRDRPLGQRNVVH
ncbi:MAG: hypothetical protein ABR968_13095 [Bacteroidales bacterium]